MAVQRRNIFGANYGSAKLEQGKARAPKFAAQTQPPVPLSIGAVQAQPPELGGAPEQGQAQGLDPHSEELLQRMLQRFGGGARG